MKVHGTHTIKQLDPAQLWDALLNPSLLVKVLPYCQDVIFLVPHERAVIHLQSALGQMTEHKLTVELRFQDQQRPHSYGFHFLVLNDHATGAIQGGGSLLLTAVEDDIEVRYDVHAEVSGFFAQIGDLFLETMTRSIWRELLTGLEKVLHQEELVSPSLTQSSAKQFPLSQWLVAVTAVACSLTIIFLWRKARRN